MFPIHRASLQTFDLKKYQEDNHKKQIDTILQNILKQCCSDFEKTIQTNIQQKMFTWNLHTVRNIHIQGYPRTDEYLLQFIEKVKETFIDCEIIIDPLKIYLTITW